MKTSMATIIAIIAITLSTTGQNYEFFDTSFNSLILDETKSMRIYLPPGYNDDTISYPVVYYLHGATGTYVQLTEYMLELQNLIVSNYINPMLVVGLDGQCNPFAGSMYTNSVLYGNYEDYIIQEAIPFAESVLRTKNSPNYRCIMGFAMGAYGSMKLAIKHPEIFAGIASFNGPLQFDTTLVMWQPEVISENPGPPYYYQYGAGIFTDLLFTGAGGLSPNLGIVPYQVEFPYDSMGNKVDSIFEKWKEHDCSRLVKNIDTISYNHPGIFFACGIYDFLYFHPTNVCFADTLDELGIDYEFLTTGDGHILSDEMLQAGMHFLDSVLYDSIMVGNIEYGFVKSNTFSIYPNPCTGSTHLQFEISETGHVICDLYDLSGVKIRQLVNEEKKPGNYEMKIDLSDLPEGVYFCVLKTNYGIQTKKIIKL